MQSVQEQIAEYGSSGECTNGMLADCIQKNYTASLQQCRDLMENLKSQHLDSIIENLSAQTDYDDIKCAISTVDHEYSEYACGPAKNEVLDAFMEVHLWDWNVHVNEYLWISLISPSNQV